MTDKPAAMSWDQAKNILAVRLDALGDVLMTTPAIRALKESVPGRRITLLASPSGSKVAGLIPEIDEVMVYEAPWMKASPNRLDSRREYLMAAQIQQAGFDAAVIFTVFSQSALPAAYLCYLANIPLRLAYSRENPYQLLTDWAPEDTEWGDRGRHEVRRQLDLVAAVQCRTQNEHLSLHVTEHERSQVRQALRHAGVNLKKPWVVVHPGSTAASRRYPEESFAQVARSLVTEAGIQVVFTGSEQEKPLVESIQAAMEASSTAFVGRLSLAGLSALLSLAPLLISNNTGPVHIAAAVGTPVVDLYALTNPQHTPWQVACRVLNHDVPCKYCYKSVCPLGHHDCLRKVSPESVVQAALELLQETSSSNLRSARAAKFARTARSGNPGDYPRA